MRTCTCDVKAATNRDHDPGCEVQPVLDENTVIAAIRERRQIGESLRKLTGADAAGHGPTVVVDQRSTTMIITEINANRVMRGHPPLRAIPGITT